MKVGARTGLVSLLFIVVLRTSVYADDCSGFGDCYNTLRGALAALVAMAMFAILLFMLIEAFPILGWALMVHGSLGGVTGKDPITGRQLEDWERVLGLLPVVGLAFKEAGLLRSLSAAFGELAVDTRGIAALGEEGLGSSLTRAAGELGESRGTLAGGAGAGGAANVGAAPLPKGFPDLNPTGCTTNCGPIADAVEGMLAGRGIAPAGPSGPGWPKLAPNSGMRPFPTPEAIEAELQLHGSGARGIIAVDQGASGHYFNAVNGGGGRVVAIDGQQRVYGPVADVAARSGYGGPQATWWFFRTWP